ncbi:hypothetical protein L0F63_000009 [Massospora cicadina]|nr:hypothetical protein L0F63_000009 [Massospora cicadina]
MQRNGEIRWLKFQGLLCLLLHLSLVALVIFLKVDLLVFLDLIAHMKVAEVVVITTPANAAIIIYLAIILLLIDLALIRVDLVVAIAMEEVLIDEQ